MIAQGSAVAKATAVATSGAQSLAITGLGVNSFYTAYVIVVDGAGNASTIYTVTFKTTDPGTEKTVVNKREKPSPENVIAINEEIQYDDQLLANILQLQLLIQSYEDKRTLESLVSQETNSIINPETQLGYTFREQLIKEKGLDSFAELVSISKNLNEIEFSKAFERIYGQSFIRWYVQTAAPKMLSEFELISPSSNLRRLIDFSSGPSAATQKGVLKQEKEVLQKSLVELVQDSLIAYGGSTKLALFLDSANSASYKSRPLTAFRLIYGYTFQQWYKQVGKFDLQTNLGIGRLQSPNLKMNKDPIDFKQTETASNLSFGTKENLREGTEYA